MKESLQKLISLLTKKEKKKLGILLFSLVIGSFLEIVGIGALPAFIAVISNPDLLLKYSFTTELVNHLNIKSQMDMLVWGATFLITVFIVKNIIVSVITYYKSKIIFDIQVRMSHELFMNYLKAPYTFHLNRNSSELLSNVYDAVKIIITGVAIPVVTMITELLLMISIVILLVTVEPIITSVTLLVFASAGAIYLGITKKKSVTFGRVLNELRSIVLKIVTEGLVGFKDARVLNREDYFIKEFYNSSRKNADGMVHQSFINGLAKPILETVTMCIMLLITIFLVIKNNNDIAGILPSLALFGFASIRLMPSFNLLLGSYSSIRYSIIVIEPVWKDFNYLRNEKNIEDQILDAENLLKLNNQIELINVSYQYPGSDILSLKNINIKIKAGTAVAFVGSSGAGKTTIVDALLGLLQPTSGKIEVDGIDIKFNIYNWQKQIGYIPQHIFLADNSIKKNVAFGVEDDKIDDNLILEAIRLAQLENVVNDLPEGLETNIGERGVKFSGGQRQRIGIARALYHNPQILIMDEATSALDNITEKSIVQEIEALKGNRTIIVIAHRLTTVMNCDTIYFMDKGIIVDSGSYQELINKNESFRRMALMD